MPMKPKKLDERMIDARLKIWDGDQDLAKHIHLVAKEKRRTLPQQIIYMLRKAMEAGLGTD